MSGSARHLFIDVLQLSQRENTILELRSKVNVLESTLSKQLKLQAQARDQPTGGPAENSSLIDPANWASMATDRSSSPALGPPVLRPVQKRDTAMNAPPVLTAATATKTPAVPRHPQVTPAAPGPPTNVTVLPSRTPAYQRPQRIVAALKPAQPSAGPSAASTNARQMLPPQTNKTRFSKLARSSSELSDVPSPGYKNKSPTRVRLGKRTERPDVSPLLEDDVPPKPPKRQVSLSLPLMKTCCSSSH